jgi:hypothetical protein
MAEELYDTDFPNLRKLGYTKTSPPAYPNCIAFVVGDTKRKWWPDDYDPFMSLDYWPKGVPKEETLEAFVQALATEGFEPCAGGEWEDGFEKVAIYALNGVVKHAALQYDRQWWRSKLASDEDIQHTLAGLEGPCYGKVVAYLKRRKKTAPTAQEASASMPPPK